MNVEAVIKKLIRKIKLRWHIYWMAVDNRPLLERLNDYDENGVPYWEKLGTVDPDYKGDK